MVLLVEGTESALLKSMDLPDPLMNEVSEDFYFCLLAKKCGFQVIVDTEIKCGHISTVKIEEVYGYITGSIT